MAVLKRAFFFWLCISFFCMQLIYYQSTAVAGVTPKEVETVSSSKVKIPTETVPSAEKGGRGWLWAILGVVVVGGAAAAIAGGGDSGGGGDDDDDDNTGSLGARW